MLPPENSEDFATADGRYFEEWCRSHTVDASHIMCQVCGEAAGRVLTPGDVDVKEVDGYAVLTTTSSMKSSSSSGQDEEAGALLFVEHTAQEMQVLLQKDSMKYKACRLHIEKDGSRYATAIDRSVSQRIVLATSRDCGRAVDGDTVFVELLPVSNDDGVIYGRVRGLLESSLAERKHRLLVCTANPTNGGLLNVVGEPFPCLYNLETPTRLSKSKRGYVSVYALTRDGEVKFHCYEKVEGTSAKRLFLVMCLTWDARFDYPFGLVVGTVTAMSNLNDALLALNIHCGISSSFPTAVEKEMQVRYPVTYNIPVLPGRVDLTAKTAFTIAEKDVSIDCAYGVEAMPNGKGHLVFVHISDVSHFVQPDSETDKEAQRRAFTIEPMGLEPFQLLPSRLANELCCFELDKQRLAVSIVLVVNAEGEVHKCDVKRTLIKCQHSFELGDVEGVLNGFETGPNSTIVTMLTNLYEITARWRAKRLGHEALCLRSASDTPLTDNILEELQIQTSHQVALLLSNKCGDFAPVTVQPSPLTGDLQKWQDRHGFVAAETLSLRRALLEEGSICQCSSSPCACLDVKPSSSADEVRVWRNLWSRVREAITDGDVRTLQEVLLDASNSPTTILARLHLDQIVDEERLYCFGDVANWFVYKHNIAMLTMCLSPSNSFVGLVVQRLLIAAAEGKPLPYTRAQLTDLCHRMNEARRRTRHYENAVCAAQVALSMRDEPRLVNLIVDTVRDGELIIRTVHSERAGFETVAVELKNLALSSAPVSADGSANLLWQVRSFDCSGKSAGATEQVAVSFDPAYGCVAVDSAMWQELMSRFIETAATADGSPVLETVFMLNEAVSVSDVPAVVVSSEGLDYGKEGRELTASLEAKVGGVVRGQVVGVLANGVITSQLQLVCPSPSFHVCVEHHRQASQCFASACLLSATRSSYADEGQYCNAWLPVLAMESAAAAVAANNVFTIRNLAIKWTRHSLLRGQTYVGSFTLPWKFCHERRIIIGSGWSHDGGPLEYTAAGGEATSDVTSNDLICVRYARGGPSDGDELVDGRHFWVAHCSVTQVKADKDKDTVTVQMHLVQHALTFPEDLLGDKQPLPAANIEWIVKPQAERYLFDILVAGCTVVVFKTVNIF